MRSGSPIVRLYTWASNLLETFFCNKGLVWYTAWRRSSELSTKQHVVREGNFYLVAYSNNGFCAPQITEMFSQCWSSVAPASQTLVLYLTSIGLCFILPEAVYSRRIKSLSAQWTSEPVNHSPHRLSWLYTTYVPRAVCLIREKEYQANIG